MEAMEFSDSAVAARPHARAWSKSDINDATRIGVMVGGFLAAEPFRSEAAFQERIVALLRGPGGPKFGAVQRLKNVMDAVMVKHA